MKVKYILSTALILIIVSGCSIIQSNMIKKDITINNQIVKVEIASTIPELVKGLSGREELCQNCGMLFEYADYEIRNFWMKDMKFPLDIIWLKDDKVAGLAENVAVYDENNEFTKVKSPEKVNRVLEVNAGFSANISIKIGDMVQGL